MQTLDIHGHSLGISTALSRYYMPELITPAQVIAVLNAAKVRFVLMGAHAIGGWTRAPRATQDVDVLVGARGFRKAVRELLTAFPQVEADDHEAVTRLRDRKTQAVLIDVMKPHQDLMQAALNNTCAVEGREQPYRIPTLEMALALKFAPMISLNRAIEKKHLDAHDFITMIKVNPEIDLVKLAELGEFIYPGGGAELVQKVGQVRRGEKLIL
jgi:hypothetical protein